MLVTDTFLHDWTGAVAAPLRLVENVVRSEWVDEFGHMNMACYLTVCDQANWAFWNWINAPDQTLDARAGREYAIVENHVLYTGELAEGAGFAIETQLLAHDAKRAILFHRVIDAGGAVCATNEVKLLGFGLDTRRAEAWRPMVAERLGRVLAAHAPLGRPVEAGRGVALARR